MLPGKYRHYKGNYYQVIAVAFHSETAEKMVLYQALYSNPDLEEEYGLHPYFVRPYAMFTEMITLDGQRVPRFEYIGPME